MEIILSKQCESFTGSLGKGFGYYIRRARHKDGSVRFFSQQSKHSPIPRDGHLSFIFACAELAKNRLHITDIKVNWLELQTALYWAKCFNASEMVRRNYADKGKANYDAADIINLKITFGL